MANRDGVASKRKFLKDALCTQTDSQPRSLTVFSTVAFEFPFPFSFLLMHSHVKSTQRLVYCYGALEKGVVAEKKNVLPTKRRDSTEDFGYD